MMKKKTALLTAAAFVFTAVLAGCSGAPAVIERTEPTEISLSWWGNDARNEYTIEAVKEFERLNPDIKVSLSYSEWSGYEARNRIRMISNTETDVMQINFGWLGQYSPDGAGYYDLYQLSDTLDLTQFTEDELSFGVIDGKLNAVPIALNAITVYINKTVYDRFELPVPTKWDDFLSAAERMNGEGYPIASHAKGSLFLSIACTEQKVGHRLFKESGALGFTPDDCAELISTHVKMMQDNVMPQAEYFDKLNISSGEYGGFCAWLSDADSYAGGAIDNGDEYVVADYIGLDETGLGWYAKPATLYAVSRNTSHPEESARLLEFLLNSEEMALLQGVEKGIPLSKKAQRYLSENNMLEGLQYEAFLKMTENTDRLAILNPLSENTDFLAEYNDCCNAVFYGKDTLENRAKELWGMLYDLTVK